MSVHFAEFFLIVMLETALGLGLGTYLLRGRGFGGLE
jgi:hypothetical protein